jgi:CDP-diacylglycerol---glycerol-3-phosphate 3-phosphatidyltransferase
MDRIKGTAQHSDPRTRHRLRPHLRHDTAATPGVTKRSRRPVRSAAARLLLRLGLSPNAVTVAGTVGVVVAAVGFAARGRLLEATIIGAVSVFFDLVDGEMARTAGRETRFGALLDPVCDRIADGALFGSVAYWLLTTGQQRAGVAALLCVVLGSTVSFVRAKAEALGLIGETGIAHRFVRLRLAGIGGALGVLGVPYGVEAVLWLIAVLSAVTVYQRVRFAHRQITGNHAQPN